MKTELNRMGRIRLFPLLFQNDCSQSSRFLPQARRIVGSGDENVPDMARNPGHRNGARAGFLKNMAATRKCTAEIKQNRIEQVLAYGEQVLRSGRVLESFLGYFD